MSDKVDWTTLINKIYPVGSIYMSTTQNTAAKVKAALGGVGTWVAWGAGRVPVGVNTSDSSFSTVEKTGGEKTHTLTVSEIPSHQHSSGHVNVNYHGGGSDGWNPLMSNGINNQTGFNTNTTSTGGGGAHNNLQPYITCYMWKRTA